MLQIADHAELLLSDKTQGRPGAESGGDWQLQDSLLDVIFLQVQRLELLQLVGSKSVRRHNECQPCIAAFDWACQGRVCFLQTRSFYPMFEIDSHMTKLLRLTNEVDRLLSFALWDAVGMRDSSRHFTQVAVDECLARWDINRCGHPCACESP